MAVGAQLDLFPTVVSAINGKVGFAPQVWAGVKPVRLRLIAAHLEPPDGFTFDDNIVSPKITALAATIDYTFGEHFDEWWVGAGTEAWLQSVEAADGSGKAEWTSGVFTLGAGYIIRFWDHFYLDPWLGVHATMNPGPRQVGDVEYEPAPVSASASLKFGAFLWAD